MNRAVVIALLVIPSPLLADYASTVTAEKSSSTLVANRNAMLIQDRGAKAFSFWSDARTFVLGNIGHPNSGKLSPGDTIVPSATGNSVAAVVRSAIGFSGGINSLSYPATPTMGTTCQANGGTLVVRKNGWSVPSGESAWVKIGRGTSSCDASGSFTFVSDGTAVSSLGPSVFECSLGMGSSATCKFCFFANTMSGMSTVQSQTATQGVCTVTVTSTSCSVSCDANS
jgi:hypothetical protein